MSNSLYMLNKNISIFIHFKTLEFFSSEIFIFSYFLFYSYLKYFKYINISYQNNLYRYKFFFLISN